MAKSKDLFDSILPKLEESKPQQVKPPKPRKRKSKVSKPNALASGISTTPSSKRKSASSRLGGAKKSKLSPEQLRTIRSNAAKKAAQTRKQRELADPEYARRMREIRIENLRKARETMKRKMQDPEYRKRMEEVWKERARKSAETRKRKAEQDKEYARQQRETSLKNLEKAREAKHKKKEEQPYFRIEEPEIPSYYFDFDYDEVLDDKEVLLSYIQGKITMNAGVDQLLSQIWADEIAEFGEDEVLIRVKNMLDMEGDRIYDAISTIEYPSDDYEKVRKSIYELAYLISPTKANQYADVIDMYANEIVPIRHRR